MDDRDSRTVEGLQESETPIHQSKGHVVVDSDYSEAGRKVVVRAVSPQLARPGTLRPDLPGPWQTAGGSAAVPDGRRIIITARGASGAAGGRRCRGGPHHHCLLFVDGLGLPLVDFLLNVHLGRKEKGGGRAGGREGYRINRDT